MIKRYDGSVESTNTPTSRNSRKPSDFKKYRCMVTEVIFTDNPRNITKNDKNPRVLYNVVIMGGFRSGNPINNCRVQKSMGSSTSYYERILRASTKEIGEERLSEHDGEIVYVEFNQGDTNYPIIVGFDDPIESIELGAVKADGPREIQYFNGLRREVNNRGEMILTRQGGTSSDNIFTPGDAEQARFEFLDDKIRLKDPVQELVWCQSLKTWTHTVSLEDEAYKEIIDGTNEFKTKVYKSGLEIREDGKEDIITRTYSSGLTVTEDGKNDMMEILTNGGARILIDGENDTIEIKDNDTGKLKITGNTVAIGASGIEVLQQISDSLDKLLNWANSVGAPHTHIGNLGYPSAPPDVTAQYTQLGSDLAAIKANIDSIKGSL